MHLEVLGGRGLVVLRHQGQQTTEGLDGDGVVLEMRFAQLVQRLALRGKDLADLAGQDRFVALVQQLHQVQSRWGFTEGVGVEGHTMMLLGSEM